MLHEIGAIERRHAQDAVLNIQQLNSVIVNNDIPGVQMT